ncbi:hypothetical protein [Micromonospora sp. WMMA2032]|uniref:hypothetical protein n=1 Tax=Micromonospora sp. WMMA2032 TaxID=2039870 RepID=UPI0012FDFEE7
MQVNADAAGRLVWASPAPPGSAHDLTTAHTHRIIDAVTSADVMTSPIRATKEPAAACTPFKRRCFRPKLSRQQKALNRGHAKIRARGERTGRLGVTGLDRAFSLVLCGRRRPVGGRGGGPAGLASRMRASSVGMSRLAGRTAGERLE